MSSGRTYQIERTSAAIALPMPTFPLAFFRPPLPLALALSIYPFSFAFIRRASEEEDGKDALGPCEKPISFYCFNFSSSAKTNNENRSNINGLFAHFGSLEFYWNLCIIRLRRPRCRRQRRAKKECFAQQQRIGISLMSFEQMALNRSIASDERNRK